jgi:NIMA (never in mitosis gene a)-related kinase 2
MFREKERHLNSVLAQKDNEIASLHSRLSQQQQTFSQHDVERLVKDAVAKREDELRVLVMKREEEVATAMGRREEEIIASVNRREAELCEAWAAREEQIRSEYQERVEWIQAREQELLEQEERIEDARIQLEERLCKVDDKLKGMASARKFQTLLMGPQVAKTKCL